MPSFFTSKSYAILALATFVALPAWAKRQRFDLRDAGSRNLVYFISEGMLEKTLGLSHALSGWVELDPDKLSEPIKGQLDIDVRTFDTGIDSMNAWMRGKLAGTPDFPLASLVLTRFVSSSRASLTDKQPVEAKVEGSLTFHGVMKTQTLLARLVYFKESETTHDRMPGNLIKISASGDLDLTAFNLEAMAGQGPSLARFIQVFADAVGTDSSPGAAPLAVATPADSPKVTKDVSPAKKP